MIPYFITGLPRSRTAWLSVLLTWGDSFCFHEASSTCGPIENLPSYMGLIDGMYCYNHIGNSDPNLGLFSEEMLAMFPKSKWIFIHRDLVDSYLAMAEAMSSEGINPDMDALKKLVSRTLCGITDLTMKLPRERKLHVNYGDLRSQSTIQAIWNYLLPDNSFPFERYRMLKDMRISAILNGTKKASPEIKERVRSFVEVGA